MIRHSQFLRKDRRTKNLHRKEEIMRKAGFSCKTVFCIGKCHKRLFLSGPSNFPLYLVLKLFLPQKIVSLLYLSYS